MLKIILSFVFFGVFSFLEKPMAHVILWTAAGYIALAIPTFVFIHQRNVIGVRICIVLAIVVSLPLKAVLGIVLDVVALSLTFRSAAQAFFKAEATA